MAVCKDCKHLILGDDHVCPSPEHVAERDALIRSSCEAEDLFGTYELEEVDLCHDFVDVL